MPKYPFEFSEEDRPIVEAGKWSITKSGYVRRTVGVGGERLLHRIILRPAPNEEVDHINGDPLDNRRENLRICTRRQNAAARRFPSGKSGYRGVSYHCGKWQASVRVDGVLVYLGRFDTAEEAAKQYDDAAIEAFGEFANLNFPRSAK